MKAEAIGRLSQKEEKNKMQYKKGNKMQYKKGQGVVIVIILIFAVLAISIFGFLSYTETRKQTALAEKQTALLAKEETKTVEEKSESTNVGRSAIARASALDLQSNTQSQVAVPAYFYKIDKDGKFIEYIGQTSARTLSASDSTSVTPVVIGDKICGIGFNTTGGGAGGTAGYYGLDKCIDIKVGGETMILDVHRTCRQDQLQGYLVDTRDNVGSNLTAGVSASNNFKAIELRVNGTDCAYNLGGWYVDVPAGTNILDIGLSGITDFGSSTVLSGKTKDGDIVETNRVLKRVRTQSEYVFELDEPLLINEYDQIKTGAFSILADGDGCSAGTDNVNISSFDIAKYQSAKQANRPILQGIEDDQDSPVDVGGADVLMISNGKGTSTANPQNGDGTTSFYCIP